MQQLYFENTNNDNCSLSYTVGIYVSPTNLGTSHSAKAANLLLRTDFKWSPYVPVDRVATDDRVATIETELILLPLYIIFITATP